MKDWLGNKGVDGVSDVLNIMDLATRAVYSFPVDTKDPLDTYTAISKMKGRAKLKHIYSDNYSSIRKAVKLLGINWETCQPGVHHSNAIIKRCSQALLEDRRAYMYQAGLPACFWPYASPYAAHIHNITVDCEDGTSPWFLRCNKHFEGTGIPFGCGVWFLPAPTKYENSKGSPKRSFCIFLGYRLQPGGLWNGEYLIADLDDFVGQNFDVDAAGSDYRVFPHVTERVDLGKRGVCFPLKPACDRANQSLDGRADAYEIREQGPSWAAYDEYGVEKKCIFSQAASKAIISAESNIEEGGDPGGEPEESESDPGGAFADAPGEDSDAPVDEPGEPSAGEPTAPPEPRFFVDSIGRRYPADEHGQKIFKSRRPAHILQHEWKKLNPGERNAICDAFHEAEQETAVDAAAAIVEAENLWTDMSETILKVHASIGDIAAEVPVDSSGAFTGAEGKTSTSANATPSAAAPKTSNRQAKLKKKVILGPHSVPSMPCKKPTGVPREKISRASYLIPACVARPVTKKEIAINPTLITGSCKDAIDK